MDIEQQLKTKANKRQQFIHKGQLVYEWDQTIDDVNVYIKPPPFLLPKNRAAYQAQLPKGQQLPKLEIKILPNKLQVGMSGNPPYLDEEFTKEISVSDSLWTLEDEECQVILQKAFKGETWSSVFKGHGEVDPVTQQEMQKKILLERFQEENPGFDFSGATMNGNVPDPRKFMGGLTYK